MTSIARRTLENGKERGVISRQPEEDQMAVLVANSTPYVIWRVGGGLVGACRTVQQARSIMRDLTRSFPDRHYVCRDVDGDLCADTRTMGQPDPSANSTDN